MACTAKVQARFEELIQTSEKIKATKETVCQTISQTFVDDDQAHQWVMSA